MLDCFSHLQQSRGSLGNLRFMPFVSGLPIYISDVDVAPNVPVLILISHFVVII